MDKLNEYYNDAELKENINQCKQHIIDLSTYLYYQHFELKKEKKNLYNQLLELNENFDQLFELIRFAGEKTFTDIDGDELKFAELKVKINQYKQQINNLSNNQYKQLFELNELKKKKKQLHSQFFELNKNCDRLFELIKLAGEKTFTDIDGDKFKYIPKEHKVKRKDSDGVWVEWINELRKVRKIEKNTNVLQLAGKVGDRTYKEGGMRVASLKISDGDIQEMNDYIGNELNAIKLKNAKNLKECNIFFKECNIFWKDELIKLERLKNALTVEKEAGGCVSTRSDMLKVQQAGSFVKQKPTRRRNTHNRRTHRRCNTRLRRRNTRRH